ncbi:hypothetical protein HOD75_02205 [archaeon]|jgi:hypothetical protein|nr:hypothetical protein [archaeon]MBT4241690.1 hypothetical protein [archaeon]MBT4418238.1 hypothetical protein [archaeon]
MVKKKKKVDKKDKNGIFGKKKKKVDNKSKDKKVVKKKTKVISKKVCMCPKCKSKDTKKIYSLRTLFGLYSRWRCKKCGHEEIVFPCKIEKVSKK